MEFSVKRDNVGRIVEANGVGIDILEGTSRSYIDGMQELIIVAKNIKDAYDPNRAVGVVDTMVAEISREVTDRFIEIAEGQLCESLFALAQSEEEVSEVNENDG